jgi:pimeloyl-ACP methyl ester carboxylesterase
VFLRNLLAQGIPGVFDATGKTDMVDEPVDGDRVKPHWQRRPTVAGKILDRYRTMVCNPTRDPYGFGEPVPAHESFVTQRYLDQVFAKKGFPQFVRREERVPLSNLGWDGALSYRDTHSRDFAGPSLVVTGGWDTVVDTMWADVLLRVLKNLGERVRVVALDMPGHGFSAKPDPAQFSYSIPDLHAVTDAFLDQVGVRDGSVHLTQSLGYYLTMYDVVGGRYRFASHVAYGTSPEQLGFGLLGPINAERSRLMGRSVAGALIEFLPPGVMTYPDGIESFISLIAWGSPRLVVESFFERTQDPAYVRAMYEIMRHVGEYQDVGRAMYRIQVPPPRGRPVSVTLLAGAQDIVTAPSGVRKHADSLNATQIVTGLGSVVTPYVARFFSVPGNHFSTGNVAMRDEIYRSVVSALEQALQA